MKNLKVFLLAMFLVISITTISGALPAYVYDGGLGTWSDVNKINIYGVDSAMCWAASASNVLAWTGWRGWNSGTNTYIDTAQAIYGKYTAAWPNTTGLAVYGYEWWMTNQTKSNAPGGPTFPSAGLNFYPSVTVLGGVEGMWDVRNSEFDTAMATYITADRGIVADIYVPQSDFGDYYHTLAVWGWDPDPSVHEIYITDSDDQMTALRTYSYIESGGHVYIQDYSNPYTDPVDVQINYLTRLNRNVNPVIEPNHGAVPEPATLILLGTGLCGLFFFRKRI